MTYDDLETRVQKIDDQKLLAYIQQAFTLRAISILERKYELVQGGTFGIIYRFYGKVLTEDGIFPWSLILNFIHHSGSEPIDRSQPSNQRYWKREPLAYQSGFFEQLKGLFVAPHCFDVNLYDDNEFWLWLEDVCEPEQVTWSVELNCRMARHIGQFKKDCRIVIGLVIRNWYAWDIQQLESSMV
jgi:hypothetical protein